MRPHLLDPSAHVDRVADLDDARARAQVVNDRLAWIRRRPDNRRDIGGVPEPARPAFPINQEGVRLAHRQRRQVAPYARWPTADLGQLLHGSTTHLACHLSLMGLAPALT